MAQENARPPERPYEVLIVEDNADDAELCVRALQKAQLEIAMEIKPHAVTDSSQAAIRIKERKFDVILLDVGMPPPDGIELTRRIRSSDPNRTTPIVIITGVEDHGLMNRAFQAGANWFLFKPIDRTRLLQVIQIARVPIERERRKQQRVRVKCAVSIEWEQGRLEGQTLDVSLKGMLVRANRILPAGSAVKVSLSLPQSTVPLRSEARVVRVVGTEFMGLELDHVGKAESERLSEFLAPFLVVVADKRR